MHRIVAYIFFTGLLFPFLSQAQEQTDKLIRVHGKVLSSADSSVLNANIYYEKLPYFDDMGMAISDPASGQYEMFLLENTKYIIRVDGIPGHLAFENEIEVKSEDATAMSLGIFIKAEEKEQLIRLDNLTFATGSATINASSFAALDDFVKYINERPDVNIQLEGHTDFAGNPAANMSLSQARVDAVAEYLIKKGVKKSRITTKAFGGTVPLTQERTDEAKALNRRVEVRLSRAN